MREGGSEYVLYCEIYKMMVYLNDGEQTLNHKFKTTSNSL